MPKEKGIILDRIQVCSTQSPEFLLKTPMREREREIPIGEQHEVDKIVM